MSAPSQFWLPSLFELDKQIHGRLNNPNVLTGAGNHPNSFLAGFKLNNTYIQKFLDDINPALTALLLAGYKVPYIELGFERLGHLGAQVNQSKYWLRIDLQNRQIEVNNRSTDGPSGNILRLKVLPISFVDQSSPIELNQARLDAFSLSYMAESFAGEDLISQPMQDFTNRIFTDADETEYFSMIRTSQQNYRSLSVWDYRKVVLGQVVSGLAEGRTIEIPLGMEYTHFSSLLQARDILFTAIRHCVFDTISWWVNSRISESIADSVGNVTAVQSSVGAEGVEPTTVPSFRLPGLLWVFDPSEWLALTTTARLPGGNERALGVITSLARPLYHYMAALTPILYSDYFDTDAEGYGKPRSSGPDFPPIKRAAITDVMGYSSHFNLSAENDGLQCSIISQYPAARVADLLIGGQAAFGRRDTRESNNKKPGDIWQQEDPYAKLNPSFEGLLHDAILNMPKVLAAYENTDQTPPAFALNSAEVDNLLHQFFLDFRVLISVANGNNIGLVKPIASRVSTQAYLDIILSLFNLNVFSIEEQIGDLNEDIPVPAVKATREVGRNGETTKLNLSYTMDDLPGLDISQQAGHDLGYSLEDSVAYEFVPAPIADPDLAEGSDVLALQAAAGLAIEAPLAKLLIVAAPGVRIRNTENWPTHVPVEIFRVQSHGQIPDLGERINVNMLTSAYPIGVLNDLSPSFKSSKSDLGQLRVLSETQPELIPVISVKPLRKPGLCGVVLTAKITDNRSCRAIVGEAAVEILMPAHSGSDRFAFDLRYSIRQEQRVVDSETITIDLPHSSDPYDIKHFGGQRTATILDWQEVDVVQFEIIIHKTPDVLINVQDNNLGNRYFDSFRTWAEGYSVDLSPILGETDNTCIYEFYSCTFTDIPPQGVVLHTAENTVADYAYSITKDNAAFDRAEGQVNTEHMQMVFDMSIGFIPVVGDLADASELLLSLATGADKWGRPITNFDRMLMLGGLALPFVSSKAMRLIKTEVVPDAVATEMFSWARE